MILSSTVFISDSAIERRRLAAAGRSRHEHHTVRLGDMFRKRLSSASGNPRMSSFSSVNCSLIDSLSRMRMTVLAVDARHDRHAEVDRLARHAQLEAAVLRDALLGDVELGHDLDARDDRAVELLAIGRIASCGTPSMRCFTWTESSCVSMWMSLARRWIAV
jgi:hypothetical protein